MSAVLVWFRRDLRLTDQPALEQALSHGGAIIPIYILDPEGETPAVGAASRWWLNGSLKALDAALRRRGSRLLLRQGRSLDVLRQVAHETKADRLVWNRCYEPSAIERDTAIKERFRKDGRDADSFNAGLLFEPWTIQTQSKKPFQVFTPFWNACLKASEPAIPTSAPKSLPPPERWPSSDTLADWALLPTIPWDAGFHNVWTPGEIGAQQELKRFLDETMAAYPKSRDIPQGIGTSRLSPHLHFGEIGPRQVWHAVQKRCAQARQPGLIKGADVYLREIGWREFAHHLLFHFPKTPDEALRSTFKRFPWRKNMAALKAWQRGRTGIPFVDAGMRELWATGWMHNRVRMITASFLTKDLLIDWRAGASWFWDTLVDADLANNTLGWQWVAGCGADAAPYFRIFNPVMQGERYDPEGDYVRRWVPELQQLPSKWIHKPSEAPDTVLAQAQVVLGRTYPFPIVDHAQARDEALAAFASMEMPPGKS